MRKIIGIIAALMLFCIALVSATEVDCGWGWNSRCSESEIQEAVDELDEDIEDLQDDVEDLEEDMEDIEDDVDAQGNRINRIRNKVNNIKDYIGNNEEDWLAGEASVTNNLYSGGNGMDENRLSKYLIGVKTLFDFYDTFMDYLYNVFATNVEVENTNLRIDNIEAIMNLGPDATENEIAIEALIIGADRRGEPLVINGLTCENGICVGVN